jgi:Glycosyl hydrolases family 11
MKSKLLLKSALAAGLLLGFSGTASAACGGSGTTGTWLSTFWTLYTAGSNTNDECLTIPATNKAEATWKLGSTSGQDGGDDIVGGIGYSSGTNNRIFKYRLTTWSPSSINDGRAYFGVYGWSCKGTARTPQEYYVVNTYNDTDSKWKPTEPGATTNFVVRKKIDGAYYNVYIVELGSARAHGCGSGSVKFFQYWSIREGSLGASSTSDRTITMKSHFDTWAFDNRGFNADSDSLSKGYQVIGPEAVINNNGSAKWELR